MSKRTRIIQTILSELNDKQNVEINLSSKNVNDEKMKLVSSAFENNKTAVKLDLSHNKFRYEGIKLIINILNTSAIINIDLTENNIKDKGKQHHTATP